MVNNQNQELESNITGDQLATEQNQGIGVTETSVADVTAQPATPLETLTPIETPVAEPTMTLPPEQAAQFEAVTGIPQEVSPLELIGTPTISEEARLARAERDTSTVSNMIAQSFFGELQDLSRSGTRLTEAERLRIFGDVFARFQGQLAPEQRVEALRQAEAKFLEEAKKRGLNDFDAVARQFNAKLDRNTTLFNAPNQQLANDLYTGTITQNDLEDMRTLDPQKYSTVIEEFNAIQSSASDNERLNPKGGSEIATPATLPIDQYYAKNGIDQTNVDRFMGGQGNALALYDSLVNNEEARALDREIIGLSDKRFAKEKELESVQDNLIKEFGGKLSSGALASLAADRTKKIRDEIETLNSQVANRTDALNNAKVDGQEEFNVLLNEREFQYDQSWKQAEFAFKVDKEQRERSWDSKKLSLDQEQKALANNIKLLEAFGLNDLNGAAAGSVLTERGKLGIDNYFMASNIDGSATFINRKNPNDVRVFIPENVSAVPLGTNKQITSNNRASVASSVGQFTAMSKAPGGRASTIGDGLITSIGGPSSFSGLDIDGQVGDPITAPIAGTITGFVTDKNGNKALEMTSVDGIKFRFNHLDDVPADIRFSLEQGIPVPVGAGEIIATLGNSGYVLNLNGQVPSAQELAAGVGSHLDLTGKIDGKYMSMPELIEYVTTGTLPGQQINTGLTDLSRLNKTDLEVGYSTINTAIGGGLTIQENRKNDFSQVMASNDPELLKRFLKNNVIETFSNTDKTSYTKKVNVVNQLNTLELMTEQFVAGGGNLGAFAGRRDKLKERFVGLSSETVQLGVAMGLIMDDVVRERTGAAFTKDEEIFYEKLFPTRNKSAALNLEIMGQLKKSLSLSSEGVVEAELVRYLGQDLYRGIYGSESVFGQRSTNDMSYQINNVQSVMATAVDTSKGPIHYQLQMLMSKFEEYQSMNNNLPNQ